MSGRGLVIAAYDRTDTQGVADSVVKYLRREHGYQVLVVGPGQARSFDQVDAAELERARFFLELDAISGVLHHTEGLERLRCPKLAWFVDTHKKPHLHHRIAPAFDLVFFTAWAWGGILGDKARWLPVHYDAEWIGPRPQVTPDHDVGFVGSQAHERTRALQEIARRHGLRLLLETTTGPREKELTAEAYARCKIVFNRHVANDLNFRLVEALGCRRLLLTDAQRNGQYELFRDREHLVYYKDDDDLERLVLHYLRHEDERERIAAAGQALAAARHTTAARVRELVGAAEELVASRAPRRAVALPRPRPTRVLVVTSAFGDPDLEPRRQRTWDLVRAWTRAHAQVEVVAPGGATVVPPDVALHGTSSALSADDEPCHDRVLEALPLLSRACSLVAQAPPFDLLVAPSSEDALTGAVLARSSGLPFLLMLDQIAGEDAADRHRSVADRWAVETATLVVVNGPEARRAALRRCGAAAGDKLRVFSGHDALLEQAVAALRRPSPLAGPADLTPAPGAQAPSSSRPGLRRPRVSVALVCCDRLDCLRRTVETTRRALAGVPFEVEWLAFDNGSSQPVRRYLDEAGLDLVIRARANLGLAAALDALHRESSGDYLLTLEDDWGCLASSAEWLQLAVSVLDDCPDVGVVRLRRMDDGQCGHFKRHRREVALRHHPWSIEPLPAVVETRLVRGEPVYVASAEYANWTNNPTLVRREVRDWLGPFVEQLPDPRDHRPNAGHPGLEGALDQRWRAGPWKVAKLLQGPFHHLGDDQPALVGVSGRESAA